MPAIRTVTVKSAGGDYTSLANAEAGEQGDLVALDRQLDIECYAFTDTSTSIRIIDGWTTDATRYIRIVAPASQRHDGKWNASKYVLQYTGTFNDLMRVSEDYTRIEGVQFVQTGATANHSSWVRVNAIGCRIDSVIHAGGGTGATGGFNFDSPSGAACTLTNSVIYGSPGNGVQVGFNGGTLNIDNCTIAQNAAYGIRNFGGTVVVRNGYCGGNTIDAYNGTITRTTCAHSSATVFSGSTASVAHSTANFVSITPGSEDYHLVSGSALIGAGTDLSATFTTDIDGNTRSAPWDIGADEFQGGGGGGFSAFLASVLQTEVVIGGGFYSL